MYENLLGSYRTKEQEILINQIVNQIDNMGFYNFYEEFNFNTCSEKFLDMFALQYNIEAYEFCNTIEEKREAVKDWFVLKRKKGTKWAVKKVISFLFDVFTLDEWFSYDALPGLFRIIVNLGKDTINTKEKYERLIKLIYAYKNIRSHLDYIRFLRELSFTLSVGFVLQRGILHTVKARFGFNRHYNLGLQTQFYLKEARKREIGVYYG